MKLFATASLLLASSLAHANVANIALDCQSAGAKKVVIAADVPSYERFESDASFAITVDGQKTSFMNQDAKKLADGGAFNIANRVGGGSVTMAQFDVNDSHKNFHVIATNQGAPVMTLTATSDIKWTQHDGADRDGDFTAKLSTAGGVTADVNCHYNTAP